MNSFCLVLEESSPVAALVPPGITDLQLDIIYCLLPRGAWCHDKLSSRWETRVLTTDDWAATQLRRVPMTLPKQTISLAFL